MEAAFVLAITTAAAIALAKFGRTTMIVWEWEQGLLFHDGRFERTLPPGSHAVGLLAGKPGRTVLRVSMQPRILAVPLQEVVTADGFTVKLGAVLVWRVADARAHHAATAGTTGPDPVHIAVQVALRSVASTRTLDALLAARADPGALDAELRPIVTPALAAVGGTIQDLSLRDLVLPAEVRRMVTGVERARREGLAALERARGEGAALRSLANAARLLRGNPELQTLRTLQALTPTPGRPAPTLVLGLPGAVPLAQTGEAAPEAAPEPDAGA